MKGLYGLIDFLALAVPLAFSFHPRIKFYHWWKAWMRAIFLVALLFLAFDALFTGLGVWSFNPRYLCGLQVINLPIEEILFFFCIPYSCLFTYYCLDKFFDLSWNPAAENAVCLVVSVALLVTGLIYRQRLYTSSTFISTAVICLLIKFAGRAHWFGKSITVFGVLLVPFFLVNGVLTGTGLAEPIVRYNNLQNLGIRVLTIPIEDFFYGFELFVLNLFFYFRFGGQTTVLARLQTS